MAPHTHDVNIHLEHDDNHDDNSDPTIRGSLHLLGFVEGDNGTYHISRVVCYVEHSMFC